VLDEQTPDATASETVKDSSNLGPVVGKFTHGEGPWLVRSKRTT
jgi:hypothetical protein